jgi:hypothetical protein
LDKTLGFDLAGIVLGLLWLITWFYVGFVYSAEQKKNCGNLKNDWLTWIVYS